MENSKLQVSPELKKFYEVNQVVSYINTRNVQDIEIKHYVFGEKKSNIFFSFDSLLKGRKEVALYWVYKIEEHLAYELIQSIKDHHNTQVTGKEENV